MTDGLTITDDQKHRDLIDHQVNKQSLMTSAQVVETSATVNNNSPVQDYIHSDDNIQPTYKKGV